MAAQPSEERVTRPLVECVPNFSEGRDPRTIDALRTAIGSVAGVSLLDVQTDASHNRSGFSFVAPPAAAAGAPVAAAVVAPPPLDLPQHKGGHPRTGAPGVVPVVPVSRVRHD